jgi:hypothetical protein
MHADPDLLSLLALGEDTGDAAGVLHAQTCPTCADELSQLQLVVTLGRSVRDEGALVVPSGDVWSRISSELALDPGLEPPTERGRLPRPAPPTLPGALTGSGRKRS